MHRVDIRKKETKKTKIHHLALLPELEVMGLAVIAVLGVFNVCSMLCAIADWVAGRTTPLTGLPKKSNLIQSSAQDIPFFVISKLNNLKTLNNLELKSLYYENFKIRKP